MTPRRYDSPAAFKQALEQRLRTTSASGVDFSRRRQILVFDRFLARIVGVFGDAAILKGGLVLELRLDRARTTKDVDLRLVGSPADILANLRRAGRLDLGDFMTFEIGRALDRAEIEIDGTPYDGLHYRTEAKLAGRSYGQPFGVDVTSIDPIVGEPDIVVARDALAFAGLAPPTLRLYPIESHIAEKLHAYTMPRARENSRVKDLPDLALLAKIRAIDADRLHRALRRTFSFRKTHLLPPTVPDPPASWDNVYRRMSEENALDWPTLPGLVAAVRAFLDPVLAGDRERKWSPSRWTW